MQKTRVTLLSFLLILLISSVTCFAEDMYPPTLKNRTLILVDGGMGVGQYADLTSVEVQEYEPPFYQIAINVIPVTFSDEYWRAHETYIGSPCTYGEPSTCFFRYDWNSKSIFFYSDYQNSWISWDINRDYSHADGDPLIPYTAETAFIAAYQMRFFGDTMGYRPVLKKYQRVIREDFYRQFGI